MRCGCRFAIALLWIVTTLCGARAAMAAPGDWVTVVHRDGRQFYGQVIEETDLKIVLSYRLGSIEQKMTFGLRDVKEIIREKEATDEELDEALSNKGKSPVQPADEKERGGYAVVPMEGRFGRDITTNFMRSMLQRGVETGAEAVIFELDSPGGYVYELERIRDIIDEYSDEIAAAFYVNSDCFSAAAMICMASKYFYIGESARFGAAVIIRGNDQGGFDAVEAKFASAEASRWRSYAEKYGRPGILIDAMMIQETEVWADTGTSPWKLTPTHPGKSVVEGGEITMLDSRVTILSLTHEQALNCGAVNGEADSADHVARLLDLEVPARIAFDGEEYAKNVQNMEKRQIRQMEQQIRAVVAAANRIVSAVNDKDSTMTRQQLTSEVRRIRDVFIQLRKRFLELDYAQFYLYSEYGWDLAFFDERIALFSQIEREIR